MAARAKAVTQLALDQMLSSISLSTADTWNLAGRAERGESVDRAFSTDLYASSEGTMATNFMSRLSVAASLVVLASSCTDSSGPRSIAVIRQPLSVANSDALSAAQLEALEAIAQTSAKSVNAGWGVGLAQGATTCCVS